MRATTTRRIQAVLGAVILGASLAIVAAAPAAANNNAYHWEGKGEAALFNDGSGPYACIGADDFADGPYGKVKINVKDGLVKYDIKIEGVPSGGPYVWNVSLYQQWCDGTTHLGGGTGRVDLGTLTTDESGKGQLKGVETYLCAANTIIVVVEEPNPLAVYLVSVKIVLPTPLGECDEV